MPAVIQVDASDLRRVVENMRATARNLPRILEYNLTRSINIRLQMLKAATPVQAREDQYTKRWQSKLIDSYSVERGPGERRIVTSVPLKMQYVTGGTRPHPIDPVVKKALWWPGIYGGMPRPHVDHPGTRPNDFVSAATAHYVERYSGDPADGLISQESIKFIVRGITAKTFSESLGEG